jgi:class 3 adenylate cyclase
LAALANELPENLQVLALPIMLKHTDRLGAALLARTGTAFTSAEVRLLQAAEGQIDSAIIQAHTRFELQRRVNELETIYRIDRIRDQNLAFEEMLHVILKEIQTSLNAESSFMMLYDRINHTLEMRASTHDDLLNLTTEYEAVRQIAYESLEQGKLLCRNDLHNAVSSIMSLPLILNDQIIGVLGAINSHDIYGFSHKEQQLMAAIGGQIDTAIFESIEQRRLRQVLGRSVDPRVMRRLLANGDVEFLKGERLVLTVLYADLRGSTQLAERTNPEELVEFMNQFLGRMTDIILQHEGTLDKFIGDQVMAIFGAPFPQPDHALRAVRTALAMQTAHQELMTKRHRLGYEAVPLGIGIATGELIVGEMGSPQQTDYTVVGRAANLGARICAIAEAGQTLISQTTYELICHQVEAEPISGLELKGIGSDLTVYAVNGLVE